jgi:HemK-like putative methylase
MPRISPWLFRQARRISPLAATLLPACRDIPSALNELRWIREHVQATYSRLHEHRVAKLCGRRGRGEPLQYVLGSQPFGSLDLKCRPGVLIPRSETEAYTYHLAHLLKSGRLPALRPGQSARNLRVVDFCSGTGCIPLLLFAELHTSYPRLTVQGVDISPSAVSLANLNIEHNASLGNLPTGTDSQGLAIARGDIFDEEIIADLGKRSWDVLVSNPPYISRDVWHHGRGQLGYSVRKHEPQLALVPGEEHCAPDGVAHEDLFYARLLDIGRALQSKVILLEIGDQSQALRVATIFHKHDLAAMAKIELWRDWPDLDRAADEPDALSIIDQQGQETSLSVKGSGNVRSVFIQTTQ